ncbi:5'-nucleotidase C-terminal domain-containing protein [Georgenia alba]|uniref:5'-nucleotidase C-terminal domain-containing protein n=1 Tax=Georgenia alba TaxID=2233858 RepID=A0ABW2Q575_9MICO
MRRRLLSALLAAGLTAALAPSATAATAPPADPVELTLLATTDTHGHVYNWDYFAGAEYEGDEALGLARVSTVVNEVREREGEESVVVVDNGDAIQGTPLTYYYGMGDGAQGVLDGTTTHPMAQAFNLIGYDAQAVGNHEYNYGLEMLETYEQDLQMPLLAANVVDVATGEPYHEPYTLIDREINGEEVTVGVLGLVTPGVRIWDRQHVEGVLEFQDMVTAARQWVPEVQEQADVVVVVAHTGQGTVADSAYDPADLNEDVAGNIARMVPGIDVLVAGHSHQDMPETVVENVEGEQVLITQPSYWAGSVTETTLSLVADGDGGFDVDWAQAPPAVVNHYGSGSADDPAVLEELADEHDTTVEYVNTPVAESVTELRAETSRYEDTPIIDFINHVQQTTVEQALVGTEHEGVPVISQASPFSRTAVFPEGDVTIRDIAGLYIYENTLRGVEITGAQLRDYLEYSARYFVQTDVGAEFDPESGTNAVYDDRPEGVPDYNYDAISGLEYVIDVSRPVGERIVALSHPDGGEVADDDVFVMAINNYRQSGGGAFPHVADAPVVYDELLEIRQLLVDWASGRGVIDPADFFVENWALTTEPLAEEPTDDPTEEPTDGATEEPTTDDPTAEPTGGPTADPTDEAAAGPTDDATDPPLSALPETGTGSVGGALGIAALALLAVGALMLAVKRRAGR